MAPRVFRASWPTTTASACLTPEEMTHLADYEDRRSSCDDPMPGRSTSPPARYCAPADVPYWRYRKRTGPASAWLASSADRVDDRAADGGAALHELAQPFVRKVGSRFQYEKGADFDAIEIDRGAQRAELCASTRAASASARRRRRHVVTGFRRDLRLPRGDVPRRRCCVGRRRTRAVVRSSGSPTRTRTSCSSSSSFPRRQTARTFATPIRRHCRVTAPQRSRATRVPRRQARQPRVVRQERSRGPTSLSSPRLRPRADGRADTEGILDWARGSAHALPTQRQRDAAGARHFFEASRTNDDPFFRADRIRYGGASGSMTMRIGLKGLAPSARSRRAARTYSSEPG